MSLFIVKCFSVPQIMTPTWPLLYFKQTYFSQNANWRLAVSIWSICHAVNLLGSFKRPIRDIWCGRDTEARHERTMVKETLFFSWPTFSWWCVSHCCQLQLARVPGIHLVVERKGVKKSKECRSAGLVTEERNEAGNMSRHWCKAEWEPQALC